MIQFDQLAYITNLLVIFDQLAYITNLLMRNITFIIFLQRILYDILLWVIIDIVKK